MYWLVSGSREFPDKKLAKSVMRCLFQPGDIVIHGMARGVDTWAFEIAKSKGLSQIKCPAEWEKHGKSAGIKRNIDMVDLLMKKSDIAPIRALVFWDGESHGTKHTLLTCEQKGIPITLVRVSYD